METVIEFIAVMIAFVICFWLLLKYGDVLGSAELLGDCYSSEAEEALDILSEGDVGSTAIAAAHIRKAIESYD